MALQTLRAGLQNLDVLAELFDDYRQFYGRRSDLPGARRFLEARLTAQESVVFLALRDGCAVGFVQLYPCFTSIGMKPIWILNDLFVAARARRAGAGQSLLKAAYEYARSSGAARLQLSTAKDNQAAKALYEAFGYRKTEFEEYELGIS